MKNYLLALAALLPWLAVAQPPNDNCAGAVSLPVNWGLEPTNFATGSFNQATNGTGSLCGAPAYNDVWYHFTAIHSLHAIALTNVTPGLGLQFEVRNGSCTGTLNSCSMGDLAPGWLTACTPGQQYYVRVYTQNQTVPAGATFRINVTSGWGGIVTNNTQYTTAQLVQDVFVAQPGLTITNVTASTGTNFGASQPNGIAYFEAHPTTFSFGDGIILSTGNALDAEGPNDSFLSSGTAAWPGDAGLDAFMGNYEPGYQSINATKLEFNFVPDYTQMAFAFMFASEEYGSDLMCSLGDACAIILTDTQTDVEVQLAYVPLTTTPISASAVHPAVNAGCPAQNMVWFGGNNSPTTGNMNYNGNMNYFVAHAPVIPGQSYHLKIVVADNGDPTVDSALLLKGSSFNIGQPVDNSGYIPFEDLPPLTVCDDNNDGYAQFDLGIYTDMVNSLANNGTGYTVAYFETEEDAEDNVNAVPNLYTNVTAGTQTVYARVATAGNASVYEVGAVVLVVQPAAVANLPSMYVLCDTNGLGYGVFDLTTKIDEITGGATGVTVLFYETAIDAAAGANTVPNPTNYSIITNPLTLYVAVYNQAGCASFTTLTLKVLPMPDIESLNPLPSCGGIVDLTTNLHDIPDFESYIVTYHTTEEDAADGIAPIATPEAYYVPGPDVVWVRIELNNAVPEAPACYTVLPQVIDGWEMFVYVQTSGTEASLLFAEDAEVYTYTFALNGQPVSGEGVFTGLEYGQNTITVTNTGCGEVYIINFLALPAPPVGNAIQPYVAGQTLDGLDAEGQNIQWYANADGTNPLPPNTPVQDGVTYYASQTVGGFESPLLAVTVSSNAGNSQNSLAALSWYPNPVTDVIKLSHTANLKAVTVFNTLGQAVLQKEVNSTFATLNLAHLSGGIYMVKVEAENGERVIKIVKE